jgi:hypothetical protein
MMSANPSSPGKNAKTVRSDTVTGVQTPTPLLVCEFPIILCMYEEKKSKNVIDRDSLTVNFLL